MPGVEEFASNAVKLGGGHQQPHGAHACLAVSQVEVPAIKKHEIEIEFVGQLRPEFQPLFVEGKVFAGSLIGADNGGVSTGAAKADIASFKDRHIFDAVFFCKIVGRGKSMQTAADDNHIIVGLERPLFPEAFVLSEHGGSPVCFPAPTLPYFSDLIVQPYKPVLEECHNGSEDPAAPELFEKCLPREDLDLVLRFTRRCIEGYKQGFSEGILS